MVYRISFNRLKSHLLYGEDIRAYSGDFRP
jgi:hypothetical protein